MGPDRAEHVHSLQLGEEEWVLEGEEHDKRT